MKLIKNIFLYLCILTVCMILFVSVLEILTRAAVGIYSGDANSFRYGFNPDIKLERHGKKLAFKKQRGLSPVETRKKVLSQKPNTHTIKIAAFGGSTTNGYNCSKNASSWPEELEQTINSNNSIKSVKVLNYGKGYTNSDYAVEKLLSLSPSVQFDYVLWANFVNEGKILYEGIQRNHTALKVSFGDILLDDKMDALLLRSRNKIFLQRLDKTLKTYLLFYQILSDIGTDLVKKMQNTHTTKPSVISPAAKQKTKDKTKDKIANLFEYWIKNEKIDRAIAMVVENYRLNFIAAKKYCDAKGIKIILIKLPIFKYRYGKNLDPYLKNARDLCEKKLTQAVKKIAETHNVQLVNVDKYYQAQEKLDELFCDDVHQYKKGHVLTAEIISSELNSIITRDAEGKQ